MKPCCRSDRQLGADERLPLAVALWPTWASRLARSIKRCDRDPWSNSTSKKRRERRPAASRSQAWRLLVMRIRAAHRALCITCNIAKQSRSYVKANRRRQTGAQALGGCSSRRGKPRGSKNRLALSCGETPMITKCGSSGSTGSNARSCGADWGLSGPWLSWPSESRAPRSAWLPLQVLSVASTVPS